MNRLFFWLAVCMRIQCVEMADADDERRPHVLLGNNFFRASFLFGFALPNQSYRLPCGSQPARSARDARRGKKNRVGWLLLIFHYSLKHYGGCVNI